MFIENGIKTLSKKKGKKNNEKDEKITAYF